MNYIPFLILQLLFNYFEVKKDHHFTVIPIDDKIAVTPSMIINESEFGDATLLVDEQKLAGDPANGQGGNPQNTWFPGWIKNEFLPVSALIDLGSMHAISQIYIFDGNGKGAISISTGTPFQWEKVISDNLNKYNSWKSFEIHQNTRYIQIKLHDRTAPTEIIIYGKALMPEKPQPRKTVSLKQPSFDQFLGVNAFVDDPINKITVVAGFIREYHNWKWDEAKKINNHILINEEKKWNPSYAGGNRWYFDEFYTDLKKKGVMVAPCIQGNVPWFKGDGHKPVPPGASPLDPQSYKAHADHIYQYVARYANHKLPIGKLKLAPDQPKVSGLNLIKYFEDWNEPNNWWSTRGNHFTPYEYAAISSADYDGHMGKLGNDTGLKNADPTAKMVMGGLASLNLDYVKAIKIWADHYRNGELPFDALNFHHYSRSNNNKVGISPEEDQLKEKMKDIVHYRNRYFPNKEVWLTEFGYDTHPNSPQRAPNISDYTQEEVQGQWLVRSFLELYAAGVDRAAMYMFRDVDKESETKYNTSGLTSGKNSGWKPKPSWFYLATLKKWLTDMHFTEDISSGQVKVYKFNDKHFDKTAYAIWSPTSQGKEITYTLAIHPGQDKATLVKLENDRISLGYKMEVNESKVTLTVSETPSFVIIES